MRPNCTRYNHYGKNIYTLCHGDQTVRDNG